MAWTYQNIFENLADGSLLFELASGQVLEINPQLAKWLGYSRSEAKRLNIADLHPASEHERCQQALMTILKEGSIFFSTRYLRQDKTQLLVDISASAFAADGKMIVMGTSRLHQTSARELNQRRSPCYQLPAVQNKKLIQSLALRTRIEKEKLMHRITLRIHESLDLAVCLQTTVDEVRQLLQADRALVYCFEPAQNGYVLAESVEPVFKSIAQILLQNPILGENYAELLKAPAAQNRIAPKFEVKTQLTAPILKEKTLWGMLVVHQCRLPRTWQNWESDLLEKLSIQISIALRQADLYDQSQAELVERKRIAKALEVARDKAIAAAQNKSQFLAIMSHEIRTPLNGVIGMTGLLSDTHLTEEQQGYVSTIHSCSENLLSLINNTLDFSKGESESLELETVSFSVRRCVEEALDVVSGKAIAKQLQLSYKLCPSIPRQVIGDVARLRQILVNLLSNAVKFTESGSVKVEVSGTAEPSSSAHRLHFAVRDTGIGIPADKFDRLFQPFVQVDSSISRQYGGTGLGLTIAQQLCQLMQGQLSVGSRVGEGSCFSFGIVVQAADDISLAGKRVLVVEADQQQRAEIVAALNHWHIHAHVTHSCYVALANLVHHPPFDAVIVSESISEMDSQRLIHGLRSHTPALPILAISSQSATAMLPSVTQCHPPVTPAHLYSALQDCLSHPVLRHAARLDATLAQQFDLTILVAEDNLVNQKLVRQWLHKMGYPCNVVSNGQEVIEALRHQSYDLILMDVQMPELDGISATRMIHQAWPAGQRPTIIAMTANATASDRAECLNAGMDSYISKPVYLPELVAAIKRCGLQSQKLKTVQKSQIATAEITEVIPTNLNDTWIDRTALEAIAEQMGGLTQSWLAPFVPIYEQQSETLLQQIVAAAKHQKSESLVYAAHTLKSSSAALGLIAVAQHCQQLESDSKNGHLDKAEAAASQLVETFSLTVKALKSFLQGLPK